MPKRRLSALEKAELKRQKQVQKQRDKAKEKEKLWLKVKYIVKIIVPRRKGKLFFLLKSQ